MNNQFSTLLIDHESITLCNFEPDGNKVSFVKAVTKQISDSRDHKLVQKTLGELASQNPDLPSKLFAVWPEYKTLTGVFTDISLLAEEEMTQKVREKYSLARQDIETVNTQIDDHSSQVTIYPKETKDLYLKYSEVLKMEFLGFAPVVLGMEKFAKEKEAIVALKTENQYILAAVKDGGVYYTETVNSPDPVEFVTRLTRAIEFVKNKKEYQLNISKVALIGFPKTPEIKLPSKISIINKPITVKNLTAEVKSLYLDSILSARLVVKSLPQEPVHETQDEDMKNSKSSTEEATAQSLENKEKTAMPEEYTNENENEDTLRRLNDSRDYRYYDEETTSWKAWLVGVIIILVVLFLVVGVLARAGYLPFNVPFFSPSATTETNLTPTPTPAPIVQSTPTPAESSPSASVEKDEFSVQIQNGSGKAGAAGTVTTALDEEGYDTLAATNAPTEDYASTEIYNVGKASDDFISTLIADLKTAGYSATDKGSTLPDDVKTTADVVIILGAR